MVQSFLSSQPKHLLLTVFFACASAAFPKESTSQEVVPVRDPPTCGHCKVLLHHIVTLGEREGPGRVMPPTAMARDSEGDYLVAHGDGSPTAKQIWVFDSEGRFKETIGRDGEGPGEYRSIRRIDVLPGDTIEVFDSSLRRRTVLSPDGDVLSITPYQSASVQLSARLSDGWLVLNTHLQTPGRVGYPLQLLDDSGEIVRSFGSVDPDYRPREPVKYWRPVAAGRDKTTVWSVGYGDYLVEQWDTSGARLTAFQREATWPPCSLTHGHPVRYTCP